MLKTGSERESYSKEAEALAKNLVILKEERKELIADLVYWKKRKEETSECHQIAATKAAEHINRLKKINQAFIQCGLFD